jgi:hypothetical protein
MSRYRIIERDTSFFAPQFKSGLFWKFLNEGGTVLPWGTVWSGPLELAAKGIRAHMAEEFRLQRLDDHPCIENCKAGCTSAKPGGIGDRNCLDRSERLIR